MDPLTILLIGGAAALFMAKGTVKGGGKITLSPGKTYQVRFPLSAPEDSLHTIQTNAALNLGPALGGITPMFRSVEVDDGGRYWVTCRFQGPTAAVAITVPTEWVVGMAS